MLDSFSSFLTHFFGRKLIPETYELWKLHRKWFFSLFADNGTVKCLSFSSMNECIAIQGNWMLANRSTNDGNDEIIQAPDTSHSSRCSIFFARKPRRISDGLFFFSHSFVKIVVRCAEIIITQNGWTVFLNTWNKHKLLKFYFPLATKREHDAVIVYYIVIDNAIDCSFHTSYGSKVLTRSFYFEPKQENRNPFFLSSKHSHTHIRRIYHVYTMLFSGFDKIAQRLLIMYTPNWTVYVPNVKSDEKTETACTIEHRALDTTHREWKPQCGAQLEKEKNVEKSTSEMRTREIHSIAW